MSNGQNDLNKMGQVSHLNGKTMLHPWSTDECNSVGGSDGMFFPRDDVLHGQTIHLFHKDSCRKLPLTFHSKEKVNFLLRFAILKIKSLIIMMFVLVKKRCNGTSVHSGAKRI